MKSSLVFVVAASALAVAVVACGASKDSRANWLEAKLETTTVDVDGVKVEIAVPVGLPQNKKSLVGPDWRLDSIGAAGPRIGVRLRDAAWKTPDELARDVEPDAKRVDLVEVSREALDGGRLRYVSAAKGNHHVDVAVWIPVDEARGLHATCHWYAGPDAPKASTPDAKVIAWLTKICDTVRVSR